MPVMSWLKKKGARKVRLNQASSNDPEPLIQGSNAGAYRPDAPIDNPSLDRFDRAPFAKRVAQSIVDRSDASSLVIALYGPWGDGKTTVLNFIRKELALHPSVITVAFNPWRTTGEDELLRSFFTTLADALDGQIVTTGERIGGIVRKYGDFLKIIPRVGDAIGGTGKALPAASVDELKNRIGTLLREAGRRVVIIMDDIDRLNKEEIQAIFRLVKLTGDFDGTAYVLAFDELMVAAAVGEKYASSSGNAIDAGTNFLEKIVQVPLHLPPCSNDALTQYCFELVLEAVEESRTCLTQSQFDEFASDFLTGLAIRLKTPRMAKRYANALHFSLAVLNGETYTPDLLLIEGIRIFFPTLYDAVRRNRELVLRSRGNGSRGDEIQIFISENLKNFSEKEKAAASRILLSLFPRTGSATYGNDWNQEFARKRRISSEYYFDRYFTYGITSSDVPDSEISKLFEPSASSAQTPSELLKKILNERNAERIIYKLRLREDEVSAEAALRIGVAVAECSSVLPDPRGFMAFHTPMKQGAVLISRLLRRIPEMIRLNSALEVVRRADSVKFLCELPPRITHFQNSTGDRLYSPHEEEQIRAAIGDRISVYLSSLDGPVFLIDIADTAKYLSTWEWCSGSASVQEYVIRQLDAYPQSIIALIKSVIPSAWEVGSGRPVQSEFERHSYDTLRKFVDVNALPERLRDLYGAELDREPDRRDEQIIGLELAREFLKMHEAVLKESAAKPAEDENQQTT